MQKITQTSSGGNTQPPALEHYNELMLRALLAALKYLPLEWSQSGWLTLDRQGRNYLAEEGIKGQDLRQAINDGVRTGQIARKLSGGCPSIALATKAVQR